MGVVVARRFDLSGSVAAIQLSYLLATLPQGVAETRPTKIEARDANVRFAIAVLLNSP